MFSQLRLQRLLESKKTSPEITIGDRKLKFWYASVLSALSKQRIVDKGSKFQTPARIFY
jgi:hypothetical protein